MVSHKKQQIVQLSTAFIQPLEYFKWSVPYPHWSDPPRRPGPHPGQGRYPSGLRGGVAYAGTVVEEGECVLEAKLTSG